MPRPRRPDRERIGPPVTEDIWRHLCDDEPQEGDDPFAIFLLHNTAEERELWREHGAAATAAFVAANPCRRLSHWWLYDAPEQRRRIDGKPLMPNDYCRNGVPVYWPYNEKPVEGETISYESQAAFLRRNGLLSDTEARHLRRKDFEPEVHTYEPTRFTREGRVVVAERI